LDLKQQLKPFFEPETVAIVGATKGIAFGAGLPLCLSENGHRDKLRLVNPREKEIIGLPVFPDVEAIPGKVDLAIVVVPAPICLQVFQACARKGIKSIILEAAGFSETGPEGKKREEELKEFARSAGMRVIGPNCIGVVNTANKFISTQVPQESLTPGPVSVVAQSGVFGNIILDWGPENGVRFAKVITIGNRMDVGELDLIEYLADDPATKVIVLYLEGVQNGRAFLSLAARVTRKKPILILKSGRSEVGRKAVLSHTGSLSGDDAVFDAAFRQCGVVRSDDFYGLFDLARAFSVATLPKGKRTGIITSTGSIGVQTSDACVSQGLSIPDISERSRNEMKKVAPAWMSIRNPLDVGPSGLFGDGMNVILTDPDLDGIIGIPVLPSFVAKEFVRQGVAPTSLLGNLQKELLEPGGKTLLLAPIGNRAWIEILREAFGDQVPIISSPENAARVMAALARYREYLEKSKVKGEK
jgi:acyl-CoA synthetase (NDP forming)